MSDRFKFRVWDGVEYINLKHALCEDFVNLEGDKLLPVCDGIFIEQCTGLKEETKNGKLFFEGDKVEAKIFLYPKAKGKETILQTGNRLKKGKVEKKIWTIKYVEFWNYTGFVCYGEDRRFHVRLSKSLIRNYKLEITGNIHEVKK